MKSTVNEGLQVPLKKVLRNTRPEDGTRGKPMDTMEPPPYTVKQVAALTGWSVQTVIRVFEHERDVIIYEEKRARKRASYRTIRIPRYVYRRVIQKLTVQ